MVAAAVLVAAVATVLLIPLHVQLDCDIQPNPPISRIEVRLRWWIFRWQNGTTARRLSSPARQRRRRPLPFQTGSSRRLLTALRSPGFAARLCRLGVELLRLVAPGIARGRVRFGFDDPAATGIAFGVADGLIRCLRADQWRLELEPEFTGPTFAVRVHAQWRVRPGAVLWPLGTFVTSPASWRAVAGLTTAYVRSSAWHRR